MDYSIPEIEIRKLNNLFGDTSITDN